MVELSSLEPISLKNHPDINEKKIQEYIMKNPSILGLGELEVITSEKVQPSGGRLDLLLTDETDTRYELELQLGSTDEPHIIRTIEYWDVERKRYPQYDHCAVIAAEDITSRFYNVISLFNGTIPLVALKMNAYKGQNGNIIVTFTKVLDRITMGTMEEETAETVDLNYWIKKSSKSSMNLVQTIFESSIDAQQFTLTYRKFFNGLSKNGVACNFVSFRPKKKFVWMIIKADKNEEIIEKLENTDLEYSYLSADKKYKIRLSNESEYISCKTIIDDLVKSAMNRSGF